MAKYKLKAQTSFKVQVTMSEEEAATLFDLLYRHIGGEASCEGTALGRIRSALAKSFAKLRESGTEVDTLRLYRDEEASSYTHSVVRTRKPGVRYDD